MNQSPKNLPVKNDIEAIVDFILEHSTYEDRDKLKAAVEKNIEYKTFMVVYGESVEDIAAIVRWSVYPSGTVAEILDVIVAPKYRKQGLLRRMLLQGLRSYPKVEFLEFEEGYDDGKQEKPKKTISVKDFLRLDKGGSQDNELV